MNFKTSINDKKEEDRKLKENVRGTKAEQIHFVQNESAKAKQILDKMKSIEEIIPKEDQSLSSFSNILFGNELSKKQQPQFKPVSTIDAREKESADSLISIMKLSPRKVPNKFIKTHPLSENPSPIKIPHATEYILKPSKFAPETGELKEIKSLSLTHHKFEIFPQLNHSQPPSLKNVNSLNNQAFFNKRALRTNSEISPLFKSTGSECLLKTTPIFPYPHTKAITQILDTNKKHNQKKQAKSQEKRKKSKKKIRGETNLLRRITQYNEIPPCAPIQHFKAKTKEEAKLPLPPSTLKKLLSGQLDTQPPNPTHPSKATKYQNTNTNNQSTLTNVSSIMAPKPLPTNYKKNLQPHLKHPFPPLPLPPKDRNPPILNLRTISTTKPFDHVNNLKPIHQSKLSNHDFKYSITGDVFPFYDHLSFGPSDKRNSCPNQNQSAKENESEKEKEKGRKAKGKEADVENYECNLLNQKGLNCVGGGAVVEIDELELAQDLEHLERKRNHEHKKKLALQFEKEREREEVLMYNKMMSSIKQSMKTKKLMDSEKKRTENVFLAFEKKIEKEKIDLTKQGRIGITDIIDNLDIKRKNFKPWFGRKDDKKKHERIKKEILQNTLKMETDSKHILLEKEEECPFGQHNEFSCMINNDVRLANSASTPILSRRGADQDKKSVWKKDFLQSIEENQELTICHLNEKTQSDLHSIKEEKEKVIISLNLFHYSS